MTSVEFVTGLLDWLLADPSHIVTAASALAAVTPTPNPATPMGKLYSVLELFALNVLRAKDPGTLAAVAAAPAPSPLPPLAKAVGVLAVLGFGLALSACAGKPPATDVFAIRAGYDATVLVPMVAYARLPTCPAGEPGSTATAAAVAPVCSDPDVLTQLRKADTAAKATLDAAEATVRANPQSDASTAVTAARNAVTAVQGILAAYNIH